MNVDKTALSAHLAVGFGPLSLWRWRCVNLVLGRSGETPFPSVST